jgi:hypothetical protein
MFRWPFKRKARDLVAELQSSDHSDAQYEVKTTPESIPLFIAYWAFKIFLWLLSKWPALHIVALRQFGRFAIEHEPDQMKQRSIVAAVELLKATLTDSPSTFAYVAKMEAAQ